MTDLVSDSSSTSAATPQIHLYSYLMSPFAARVHAVLLHKRLPFVVSYVNPVHLGDELPTGTSIPVLTIGDQVFNDSHEIIEMLERQFPHHPVHSDDWQVVGRTVEFLAWIDKAVVPTLFASVIPRFDKHFVLRLRRGWRLGELMNMTIPAGLSFFLRMGWPVLLPTQKFVREFAASANTQGGVDQLSIETKERFALELGAGPFLFESEQPTLADLICFGTVAPAIMTGVLPCPFGESKEVQEWFVRLNSHLTGTPPLIPTACIFNMTA